jgi:hypothetical protein
MTMTLVPVCSYYIRKNNFLLGTISTLALKAPLELLVPSWPFPLDSGADNLKKESEFFIFSMLVGIMLAIRNGIAWGLQPKEIRGTAHTVLLRWFLLS